jgi:hypothetical protein
MCLEIGGIDDYVVEVCEHVGLEVGGEQPIYQGREGTGDRMQSERHSLELELSASCYRKGRQGPSPGGSPSTRFECPS